MVAPFIFAAGAGLSFATNLYGALQQKKELKRQARSLEDQANIIEEEGRFQALETAKKFDSLLGEQKVSVATSGAEMEGSVLNIFDKTIADKEQNVAIIKRNAEMQANYLRDQARQIKKKGKRLLGIAAISSIGNLGQSFASYDNTKNKTLTQ